MITYEYSSIASHRTACSRCCFWCFALKTEGRTSPCSTFNCSQRTSLQILPVWTDSSALSSSACYRDCFVLFVFLVRCRTKGNDMATIVNYLIFNSPSYNIQYSNLNIPQHSSNTFLNTYIIIITIFSLEVHSQSDFQWNPDKK